MRTIVLVVLMATSALAQTSVRGTTAGTNDHAVTPLRSNPKIAWEIKPRYRDASALVVSGTVLVTGNTSGTGGTFAYDTATGKQLWSVPGHIRGEPAVDATAAYAVNDTKSANRFRLSKLDLKTGKALWSVEDEDLGNHDSAPVLTGAQVVLTSRNRAIAGYAAASGQQLWRHDKTNTCEPSLSFANGLIYFSGGLAGTSDTLTVLDAATGTTLWAKTLGTSNNQCGTATAVTNGIVVTGLDTDLLAFDAKTGASKWQRSIGSRKEPVALGQLVVTGGIVYTASGSDLLGFDLASGRPVFQLALPNPADVSKIRLASAGGVMFLHSVGLPPADSSMLYAIDLAGKQVLWSHASGRPDRYDPTGRWPTRYFVPVDNGLYYENQQLIVKLAGQ